MDSRKVSASAHVLLAAVHVYWATGTTWPAGDERSLSLTVLNAQVSFSPGVVLPLAAVHLLLAGAILTSARWRLSRLVVVGVVAGSRAAGSANSPPSSRTCRTRTIRSSRSTYRTCSGGSRRSTARCLYCGISKEWTTWQRPPYSMSHRVRRSRGCTVRGQAFGRHRRAARRWTGYSSSSGTEYVGR